MKRKREEGGASGQAAKRKKETPDECEEFDLVVVGGGPIGLATAWQAAAVHKKKVLVLERSVFFNFSGSSGDLVRMFRTMYTESFMADLAQQAMKSWDDLEQDAGTKLRLLTGLLNFGNPDYKSGPEGNLLAPIANLKRLKMPFQQLDAKQIQEQMPFINLPATYQGLYAPDNGNIDVQKVLRELYRLCKNLGCVLQENCRVQKIHRPNSVTEPLTVYTTTASGGSTKYSAKRVAITSGAYTNDILQPSFNLSIDLDIWEMVYQYYSTDPSKIIPGNPKAPKGTIEHLSGNPFKCMWFLFENNSDPNDPSSSNLIYGFPSVPWGPDNLARIAVDNASRIIKDPKDRRTTVDPVDSKRTTDWLKKHAPSVVAQPYFQGTCLQTNVVDNMFVLDYVPNLENGDDKRVVVFTAGWAFKFIPLIGGILSDMCFTPGAIRTPQTTLAHFSITRPGILNTTPSTAIRRTPLKTPHFTPAGSAHHRNQPTSLRALAKPTSSSSSTSIRARIAAKMLQKRHFFAKPRFEQMMKMSARSDAGQAVGEQKILIVGAGAAGLYAAMILSSLGLDNYAIIEAEEEHIGGRIRTYRFDKDQDNFAYADLGAMRFPVIPTMDRVFDLVDTINKSTKATPKVEWIPYYLEDPNKNELVSFNGQTLRAGALTTDEPLNFGVSRGGGVPDSFVNSQPVGYWLDKAFEPLVNKLATDFDAGFEELMQYDKFSTREFLRDFLASEKFPEDHNLLKSSTLVGHYPATVIDWLEARNSGTGNFDKAFSESIMDALDFEGAEWKCISGGTQRLVDGMVEIVGEKKIQRGCAVTKMADDGGKIAVTMKRGGVDVVEKYDQVISTVPFGVFRMLDTAGLDLSYEKRTAVRALQYDHSTKVALRFKYRFWEKDPESIIGGVTNTDLPVRVVVYPSYPKTDSNEERPGVMLGSYTWGQDADRIGSMPKRACVDMVLENLKILHGKEVVEKAMGDDFCYEKDAVVWNWNTYQYALGAFALYGPGQFQDLFLGAIQPELDNRLHFAGEATSVHHAWIVGALNSAYRTVWEIIRHDRALVEQLENKWGTLEKVEYGVYNQDSGRANSEFASL